MVTILNSANLNSAILDSTILHKKTSLIHSDSTWWIFNLAILPILDFPLKLTHTCQDWIPPFPKKQNFTASFLFICTIYFPHSIWLTWWWQPSWILPSWIQPFWTKLWLKLIQSDSSSFSLNLMMAAILNLAILDSVFPLKLTHTCQDWFPPFPKKKTSLTLHHLQKILHSFNLTQLDDGSHLAPSWIQPS